MNATAQKGNPKNLPYSTISLISHRWQAQSSGGGAAQNWVLGAHFATVARLMTKKLRILLFEREPANSLLDMLRALGHEIRLCDHAENCADTARDFKPHLMILHGGLSPHQAYDLAREIQGPTTVRVTAPGDILHSREALEAGIALHLVAPVMADELAAVCRQVAESLPAG